MPTGTAALTAMIRTLVEDLGFGVFVIVGCDEKELESVGPVAGTVLGIEVGVLLPVVC